jgi:hypothetical protein
LSFGGGKCGPYAETTCGPRYRQYPADMSRSYGCSIESTVSVQQIHAAFCERSYWLARLAAYSAAELGSFDVGADGSVRLTIVQDLRHAALPGPFGKLYPRDLELVQGETWTLDRSSAVRGEVRTEARGAPGSGRGTLVMIPARHGAILKCTGTFEFRVPLVGGKLESYFGRQMVDQTPEMLRFTTKWIEDHA